MLNQVLCDLYNSNDDHDIYVDESTDCKEIVFLYIVSARSLLYSYQETRRDAMRKLFSITLGACAAHKSLFHYEIIYSEWIEFRYWYTFDDTFGPVEIVYCFCYFVEIIKLKF